MAPKTIANPLLSHRARRRARLPAALLALALLPSPAWAQPSDADRATARALANEGEDALDRRDYETAYDRFNRAVALFHAPTLLLSLARSQVGLGKLVSAGETYQRLASEPFPRSNQAYVKAVEEGRRELERLTERIPSVIINVVGTGDAVVTLDGATVPSAALGVKRPVDPGKHDLQATAEGFEALSASVTLAEGETRTVTLELTPVKKEPPKPQSAPLGLGKTLGIVALGVGGAGIALGSITGIMAIDQHHKLGEVCMGGLCAPAQGRADQIASYHTVATLSTVGFIVAGASIATGVILLVVSPSSSGEHGASTAAARGFSVAPRIGAGYLGVEGSF